MVASPTAIPLQLQTPARGLYTENAHRAYLSLGANLGCRCGQMATALDAIHSHPAITVTAVSGLYETVAVGGPSDQPDYLNAAAAIETTLSPESLLRFTQSVEAKLGRRRTIPNAPRSIDIDILLFGDRCPIVDRQSSVLTIPHPRMHERAFVLRPLADIGAALLHPVLNESIGVLLSRCGGGECKRRVRGDDWWSGAVGRVKGVRKVFDVSVIPS